MTRATVVHLGRSAGMGEEQRVRSWTDVLTAAGAEVTPLPLLREARGLPGASTVVAVARGAAVPEAAAWSVRRAVAALRDQTPDLVVCVTLRAHHPGLVAAGAPIVLDFVDRLSVSYRDRAAVAPTRRRRLGFHTLALAHGRTERQLSGQSRLSGQGRLSGQSRLAAGWADAAALGAEWFPNVISGTVPIDATGADHDLLFFGNLSYAPNIAAVERLARVWPELQRRRPATTALIAGARPSAAVAAAAAANGWTLVADFAHLAEIGSRARLAVAPLVHTAGIQNKVLEAAALGLAQVVSAEAAAGLDPDFPVTTAATDDELVDAVVELLDDPARRRAEGAAAASHIARRYTPEAWAPWAAALLG